MPGTREQRRKPEGLRARDEYGRAHSSLAAIPTTPHARACARLWICLPPLDTITHHKPSGSQVLGVIGTAPTNTGPPQGSRPCGTRWIKKKDAEAAGEGGLHAAGTLRARRALWQSTPSADPERDPRMRVRRAALGIVENQGVGKSGKSCSISDSVVQGRTSPPFIDKDDLTSSARAAFGFFLGGEREGGFRGKGKAGTHNSGAAASRGVDAWTQPGSQRVWVEEAQPVAPRPVPGPPRVRPTSSARRRARRSGAGTLRGAGGA